MIYLRAAMTALGAAGMLTKLFIAAGLIAAALTAYGVWHHKVRQGGIDYAVERIARADAKLVDRALKARAKLKECQASGHEWDQSTGACK